MSTRIAIACSAVLALIFGAWASGQSESDGPYIQRLDPREWRLTANVTLMIDGQSSSPWLHLSNQPINWIQTNQNAHTFPVEQGALYWPLAGRGASYEVDRTSAQAKLFSDGWQVPLTRAIRDSDSDGSPLHSGGAYGVWGFGPHNAINKDIRMEFSFEGTTWNTRFDEARAREVAWPTGDWPAEAASTFDDMLFIDRGFAGPYQSGLAAALAEEYTAGRAQSQPPVVAAKWIAGQLIQDIQPDGMPVFLSGVIPIKDRSQIRPDHMQALRLEGTDRVALDMQGSPLDLALLLTAVYREIGLPARVVIGYVAGPRGGLADRYRDAEKPEYGVYPWVEFALYDEREGAIGDSLTWIPVDIVSMYQNNVGRRPFEQPWEGFGTSDLLSEVIPIGYHLHPHDLPAFSYGRSPWPIYQDPCRVIYEPLPALWGWHIVPAMPCHARQAVTFAATTPSRTADDQRTTGR